MGQIQSDRHDNTRQDYRRDNYRNNYIQNYREQVQVGTVKEITKETIQGKDLSEVEIQVGIRVEKDSHNHGLEWNQKVEEIVIDQEQNQDPDQVQGLVQIGT